MKQKIAEWLDNWARENGIDTLFGCAYEGAESMLDTLTEPLVEKLRKIFRDEDNTEADPVEFASWGHEDEG